MPSKDAKRASPNAVGASSVPDPAAISRKVLANILAGLVASLLTIAYCLSFSALLFQGSLQGGLAMGLWGFLIGSAIAGLYVSITTSLPPAEAGPDNPAVAVLTALAASVAGVTLAAGGDSGLAVDRVLLSFTFATLFTGIILFAIGVLKLGQIVRFIPYPVIAGFLAASGWFLLTGGVEVIIGKDFSLWSLSDVIAAEHVPKILLAAGFAAVVYALKIRTRSTYVLPVAFVASSLIIDVVLHTNGVMPAAPGWYISGTSNLSAWMPLASLANGSFDWTLFLRITPELAAIAGVTAITLMLDITGLEVARTATADLDHEFRINGAANILAAPLGGIMGNLSLNGSRLLDETGGLERMSGVAASLAVAAVALMKLDLAGLVPVPILAGLLMYLGVVVLAEILLRSPAYRSWTDFGLALLIMLAIVMHGYLAGVVFGFVAACLTFAFNYSRIAVIRRHLTRMVHASNMERSAGAERLLQEVGDRIHIFWLAGFIFFGSSNRLLESIRAAIEKSPSGRQRFAVLDFSDVSGFDTSALLSLVKLRNYADSANVTLVFAGLTKRMEAAFKHVNVFGVDALHRSFTTRNEALEWCENEVLSEEQSQAPQNSENDLEAWLAAELGGRDKARKIMRYLERRDLTAGTALYGQGDPSETIDLVVDGSVAVTFQPGTGAAHLVRRMSKRTVVGEMGFFRSLARGASVVPEQGAVIYTLSRPAYDRMLVEDPDIGTAFLEFIVRALSDRLEFANSGIAALS